MRLSDRQAEAIRAAARDHFGRQARVWLFGSRVDDSKRGGDIDLYVEPPQSDAAQLIDARLRFLVQLHRELGEQRIDVVLRRPGGPSLPIHAVARQEGVRLL